jgi:hypothetical protein
MEKARDPQITMLITLDKSQASGQHEKALLASDLASNPTAYNTSFVIGESATRQISHTKGFVADGKVAAEGSTNWSGSGEGTEVTPGVIGGPNYKAQNNTQSVITDPDTISRFTAELIAEHMSARLTADPGMKSEQKVPLGTKGTELKTPAKTPAKAPAKTPAKTAAKTSVKPPAKKTPAKTTSLPPAKKTAAKTPAKKTPAKKSAKK